MDDRIRDARNWLLVSLLAVVAAIGTAVVLLDRGLAFVVPGVVVPTVLVVALSVAIPRTLSAAWAEHRRYVWFSVGLFGVGSLIGALLLLAGVDLTDLFLELLGDELGIEDGNGASDGGTGDPSDAGIELSATFFVFQNSPPFVLSIVLGTVTLGLFTVLVMVVNGVLVGNIVLGLGGAAGLVFVVVGIVPHGIFELPALFVASGVGFRLVHRLVGRLRGTRDAFVTKQYLVQTGAPVLFAYLLLLVAAFVEAYLTHALLEAVMGA